MKIKSYQIGGNIQYLSTVDAIPEAQQSASGTSTSGHNSSAQKISDITKSVIDQIKSTDGIDSDVTTFINDVQRMLTMGADPFGDQLDIADVFKVQLYANKVKQNADYKKLAVQNLNQQNAWGEVAINERGYLYVVDPKGKIQSITPTEYAKLDKNKYQALTYKELLYFRENSKNLAFNSDILMSIQNAVGMDSIIDTVTKIVKSFGTISESKYITKEDKKVAAGLESIIGGPDGVYKITTKGTYGSDLESESNAINYILNALPKEYRNSLAATAVAEGLDPIALIRNIIKVSANREINPQYQKMASDDKNSGSKSKSGDKGLTGSKELTLAESYATGEGAGIPEPFYITPEGATVSMRIMGRSMGDVKQKDGKESIGKVNLQYLLENAYGIAGQNLDGSVSFGDQPLTDSQKAAIMYDGTTMRRVILPYKNVDGKIVPDFEIAERIENLTQALGDQIGSMTPGQLQDILNQQLPGARWDPLTNSIIWPKHKAFLTFRGYASSEFMDINKDSKYLAKVSKEKGKDLQEIYEETMKYGSLRHDKNASEYVGRATARGLFNRHADANKFYSGNVFIALDSPTVATAIYSGQEIPKDNYIDITERAEARRTRTNF